MKVSNKKKISNILGHLISMVYFSMAEDLFAEKGSKNQSAWLTDPVRVFPANGVTFYSQNIMIISITKLGTLKSAGAKCHLP